MSRDNELSDDEILEQVADYHGIEPEQVTFAHAQEYGKQAELEAAQVKAEVAELDALNRKFKTDTLDESTLLTDIPGLAEELTRLQWRHLHADRKRRIHKMNYPEPGYLQIKS